MLKEPKKADRFIDAVSPDAKADDEAIAPGVLTEGNPARPANKLLTRFHVVTKDGTTHAFMFHQLDSNATFSGREFTLLFAGAKHWEVRVKGNGPRLWEVFDYICLHRWPFIVEATRNFGGDGDTVFTEVEIKDVTPREGRGSERLRHRRTGRRSVLLGARALQVMVLLRAAQPWVQYLSLIS